MTFEYDVNEEDLKFEENSKYPEINGVFKVVVDSVEPKSLEKGTAMVIDATIVEGEHRNRKVSGFHFYKYPSKDIVANIGKSNLDKFAKAIGLSGIVELFRTKAHELPKKVIDVEVETRKDGNYTNYSIKSYSPKIKEQQGANNNPIDDSIPF